MLCPHCKDTPLVMSERKGIEIDYCPQCRGVWLDRGELDKIIDKALAEEQQSIPSQQQKQYQNPNIDNNRQYDHGNSDQRYHDSKHYDDRHSNHSRPYRKKSFLQELFD